MFRNRPEPQLNQMKVSPTQDVFWKIAKRTSLLAGGYYQKGLCDPRAAGSITWGLGEKPTQRKTELRDGKSSSPNDKMSLDAQLP